MNFVHNKDHKGAGINEKYDMLNNPRQSGKYVLIKESNEIATQPVKSGDTYILEGIFAIFGKENENGRIYDEQEYLPHLEYLMDKIKKNKLTGELDHPKEFEPSLANASHIIENLWMDKENRVLRGRLRVLDTPKGQVLKQLIDSGVSVSVSSRAAGLVENNKKVVIKKIFTYDVVADPGFGDDATLKRIFESINYLSDSFDKYKNISESVGINNKNIQVLDLGQDEEKLKNLIEKTKKQDMSYITEQDFNTYSELIKKQVQLLSEKIGSLEGRISESKSVPKEDESSNELRNEVASLRNQISELTKYSQHLYENLSAVKNDVSEISGYTDHLYEAIKDTQEEVTIQGKYADHLYENIKFGKKYSHYLLQTLTEAKKNIENVGNYADHLYENLKLTNTDVKNVEKYQEHLYQNLSEAKKDIEFNDKYSQHLYEAAKHLINESKVSNAYMEHLYENLKYNAGRIDESAKTPIIPTGNLNESKSTNINDKIDHLISEVKKKKTDEIAGQPNYHFFKMINESYQKQFLSLDETKKKKVLKALEVNNWANESDILNIWRNSLAEHLDESKKWLVEMPVEYKAKWEALSESKKNEIAAQSMNYNLQNDYSIKWFWETRNLSEAVGFIPLNESNNVSTKLTANLSLGYSAEDVNNIANEISKRFNK